jgi:hypothetical protein
MKQAETKTDAEKLKRIFKSLEPKAKLCILTLRELLRLEGLNFKPELREAIEGVLKENLTEAETSDPSDTAWLAGFWVGLRMVNSNT